MKTSISILVLAVLSLNAGAYAAAPASTPAMVEKGKQIYTTNCLTCHGEKGDGMGPAGAYLNPKPRNFGKDKFKAGDKPEQVFATVTGGLKGTTMVGFPQLPEADRWAVVYYVLKTFHGGK